MKRRNTRSKEVILDLLVKTKKAMSRDAIEQKITHDIDRATIYRILNQFCEDGLTHRIIAEDGKQYFAVCIKCEENQFPDNHFHFRCENCQTIECLPEAIHFTVPVGYDVKSVNCLLTGTCNECSKKIEDA